MSDIPNNNLAGRIIDANLNRASEGLRVVEEYLRFGLGDAHLSERCKTLRHELAKSIDDSYRKTICVTRDAAGDVGQSIESDAEHIRDSVHSVVIANLKRVQQALRSIEEYSKLLPDSPSRRIEKIRFDSYELEKCIRAVNSAIERIPCPSVYVLVDQGETEQAFEQTIRSLVDAKADFIQLRCQDVTDRELLQRAQCLVKLTRRSTTKAIINDRVDIAQFVNADGVHVGQDDVPVRMARRQLSPGQLVGVSTHSLEQALTALDQAADYIGVGPVFPSSTKSFDEFVGVKLVKEVIEKTKIPVFAIGGINTTNVAELHATGCTRVAVSAAVTAANDKATAIAQLKPMNSKIEN